jgi:RNA polymerase sigma factor (sigma-70 family)
VVAALESLPAHYLEVILLRDFAELTIGEIAGKLGIQKPGVKSRLHRARELVREYLVDAPLTQ